MTEAPFDLDVHVIPARPGEPAHLHLDIRYLLIAPAVAEPKANAESKAVAWVGLDKAEGDAGMRRVMGKIRHLG